MIGRTERGRRAVLGLAYVHAAERRGVPTEAYSEAAEGPIAPKALDHLLVQLGGDLAIDEDGETSWRPASRGALVPRVL